MAQRIYYLDNLKGILIILVILGHAIQFTIPEYRDEFAFRLIYSFHMPLFFFISGYLANRGCYKSGLVKKRAVQLLLPFVVWAIISPLLKYGTLNAGRVLTAIEYPDNGLWFLYNLFVYSTFFSFIEWLHDRTKINRWIYILSAYILLALLMVIFKTRFNCTQLCYHFIFYGSGYMYKAFDKSLKIKNVVSGGVIYAILVPFWTTGGNPLFYDYLNLGDGFAYLYRYGVQILGMMFFFESGKRFLKKKLWLITEYGTITLGVYALHFSVLHHLNLILPIQAIVIKVIVETIITVPICYVLVTIIKRIPYVRTLLIGVK